MGNMSRTEKARYEALDQIEAMAELMPEEA
jgi:hypothetical protein